MYSHVSTTSSCVADNHASPGGDGFALGGPRVSEKVFLNELQLLAGERSTATTTPTVAALERKKRLIPGLITRLSSLPGGHVQRPPSQFEPSVF